MFAEEDLLPISALQHLLFCERQCALIHVEGLWAENRLTAQGRLLHERVHAEDTEGRPGVRITRSLRLHSLRLGLVGMADVVEFHRDDAGVVLPGISGLWRPFPVEYKRGKPKRDGSDNVQLAAQVLCLEEMLGVSIPEAAFFYGRPRRRHQIAISEALRIMTEEAAARLHDLVRSGKTPQSRYEKKCQRCSLLQLCMPKVTGVRKRLDYYMAQARRLGEE